MTSPGLKQLVKEYVRLEKKILAKCDELPSMGNDCHCDDPDTFDYIHYGDYAEIMAVCLNCGGYCDVSHY